MLRLSDRDRANLAALQAALGTRSITDTVRVLVERELVRVESRREAARTT